MRCCCTHCLRIRGTVKTNPIRTISPKSNPVVSQWIFWIASGNSLACERVYPFRILNHLHHLEVTSWCFPAFPTYCNWITFNWLVFTIQGDSMATETNL